MWGKKSISIVLIIICSSEVYLEISSTQTQPQVPCYFIFGDSLTDPGNNNNLPTTAKANYFPYGIDFPGGVPTGRFTDGVTHVDVIARLLGFSKYIPPFSETFASPVTSIISEGVNYASGGAGIRRETGYELGVVIYMDQQLKNHQYIVSRLGGTVELSKCLYTVNIGSNDYINNYYALQGYNTSTMYTPEQYATVLINQYYQQMKALYNTGARKIGIFTLGELGCTPEEIDRYGNGTSCAENINTAVLVFNDKLESMVDQLNQDYSDAMFLSVDLSGVSLTIDQGFTEYSKSCCAINSTDGMCDNGVTPCVDRSTYIFYDNFHTTEAVNYLYGESAYTQLQPLITDVLLPSVMGRQVIE